MHRKDLEKKLQYLNISKQNLGLRGGLPSDAFCIDEVDGLWETYYSERGRKSSIKKFHSESEACEYFYSWMMKIFKKNN